jgi:hypothetical protein
MSAERKAKRRAVRDARKVEKQQRRAAKAIADATDGGLGELEHHSKMRNQADISLRERGKK